MHATIDRSRKAEIVLLAALHMVANGLMAAIVDFHVPYGGLNTIEGLVALLVPGFAMPLYIQAGLAAGAVTGWLAPIAHSVLWAATMSYLWTALSTSLSGAGSWYGTSGRELCRRLQVDRAAIVGGATFLLLTGCIGAYVLFGHHFGDLLVGFYMWPDMVEECGLVQGTEAWWDGGPFYEAMECYEPSGYQSSIEGLCARAGRD